MPLLGDQPTAAGSSRENTRIGVRTPFLLMLWLRLYCADSQRRHFCRSRLLCWKNGKCMPRNWRPASWMGVQPGVEPAGTVWPLCADVWDGLRAVQDGRRWLATTRNGGQGSTRAGRVSESGRCPWKPVDGRGARMVLRKQLTCQKRDEHGRQISCPIGSHNKPINVPVPRSTSLPFPPYFPYSCAAVLPLPTCSTHTLKSGDERPPQSSQATSIRVRSATCLPAC